MTEPHRPAIGTLVWFHADPNWKALLAEGNAAIATSPYWMAFVCGWSHEPEVINVHVIPIMGGLPFGRKVSRRAGIEHAMSDGSWWEYPRDDI